MSRRNHMDNQRSSNHAVLIPCPTAGHINPLLKLASVLHSRGFHITFFITEQVRRLQLPAFNESDPPPSLQPLDGFQVEVISDGLPPSSAGPDYLKELTIALGTTYIDEVRRRLSQLVDEVTPVTCVIAGLLGQALLLADELQVPGFLFWTTSACGFLPILHANELVARGYVAPDISPTDGSSTHGRDHLNRVVDWIPGLRPLRVRDMSTNFTVVDPDDVLLKFEWEAASWASRASGGVILNTCDALEHKVVEAMRHHFKMMYMVGPLSAVLDGMGGDVPSVEMSFWRDERRYLSWLDKQATGSVLYINFGSIVTMGLEQLSQLVLGVVKSGVLFLLIARPGIIEDSLDRDDCSMAPSGIQQLLHQELGEAVGTRCFLAEWCSQEEVLAHPALGGFLTHAGWNSMSESIRRGVPMICMPFLFDQPINCRYACDEWGVAMELKDTVSAHEAESVIRELMFGPKGKVLRENLNKWKKLVCENAVQGGPSERDMEALVNACAMSTNL